MELWGFAFSLAVNLFRVLALSLGALETLEFGLVVQDRDEEPSAGIVNRGPASI